MRVGAFVATVDRIRTPKYFSFAVPDPGTGPGCEPALEELCEAFAERRRIPRIELMEELTPELAGVLEANGWQLSERMPVMVCGRDQLVAPPAAEGLVARHVRADAPDEMIHDYLSTQRRAFGEPGAVEPGEVERFRGRADGGVFIAGELDGELVATAQCTPPAHGVVEVVGVATLEPYRGRGIAGALTAEVTGTAFAGDAETAWLTAADPRAERIYARAGFARVGIQRAYDRPQA
jgi:GNAT superfamily N-acetyltransferase